MTAAGGEVTLGTTAIDANNVWSQRPWGVLSVIPWSRMSAQCAVVPSEQTMSVPTTGKA